MTAPDARAVETLMGTYWSSSGWREPPTTAPQDLAHAVDAGVMFEDALTIPHDEVVAGVVEAVAQVSASDVADAFLASLTSRRLDLRSALGSYTVARHLPPHGFEAGPTPGRCAACRVWEVEEEIDRNVLNFERLKWGGVRHDDLTYALLDLQLFASADHPPATRADRDALEGLLAELVAAPPGTSAPKAARTLLRGVKGTREEREVLLDILGICSVLETPEHRGYADGFVRAEDRVLPPLRRVDRAYPVCWWKAEHGVDRRAASAFGLL